VVRFHPFGYLATVLVICLTVILTAGPALTVTFDPPARTVTTSRMLLHWSNRDRRNPEELDRLRWEGLNLTQSFIPRGCDDGIAEFFGNSYAPPDPFNGGLVLVGALSRGTWSPGPDAHVAITSQNGRCFFSAGVPVHTTYKFFDSGPAANKFGVERMFAFGTGDQAFPRKFRPYIPRLSPRTAYRAVVHPDATGTHVVVEHALDCEFGCAVSDWAGNSTSGMSWFAIEDRHTGTGVIVKRDPTPSIRVKLWVDVDGASNSNASSVLLLPPEGGFQSPVTESEQYCFFDSASWPVSSQRALILPQGC
jgi:hypothetical protein